MTFHTFLESFHFSTFFLYIFSSPSLSLPVQKLSHPTEWKSCTKRVTSNSFDYIRCRIGEKKESDRETFGAKLDQKSEDQHEATINQSNMKPGHFMPLASSLYSLFPSFFSLTSLSSFYLSRFSFSFRSHVKCRVKKGWSYDCKADERRKSEQLGFEK